MFDWLALIGEILKDLGSSCFEFSRGNLAVRTGDVYLVLPGKRLEPFCAFELSLDKVPGTEHAHIVLTSCTLQHLVEVSEAYRAHVLEELSLFAVLWSLVSCLYVVRGGLT